MKKETVLRTVNDAQHLVQLEELLHYTQVCL
jgi:hypothetical protein